MIVEMYGTCDGKNILFRNVGGNMWETIVPADMEDGTYIVEIYAKTKTGLIIYYAAVLYMCDSRFVSLTPVDDGFYVLINENRHYVNCRDDKFIEYAEGDVFAALQLPSIQIGVSTYGH